MIETAICKAVSSTFYALGTINTITIYGSERKDAAENAVHRVFEIEKRMSAFQPDSDLSRLGKNAGNRSQAVHSDTFRLIQRAVEFSELSGGAFDITIRPLVELWGINKKVNYIPSDEDIEKTLRLVNYRDILMNTKTQSVCLRRRGQAIDLGGIAKGYAADETKRILSEGGVQSALINLGGNIITLGKKPEGEPWNIGIQNPLEPTGKFLGILSIADKTVVTSGSNERFFIKDGVRYHHILDPRSGKPVQNSLLSVTAVCSCSADADALTTALFVLGFERSQPLLSKIEAEAIFIFNDLTVKATPGLRDTFRLGI